MIKLNKLERVIVAINIITYDWNVVLAGVINVMIKSTDIFIKSKMDTSKRSNKLESIQILYQSLGWNK